LAHAAVMIMAWREKPEHGASMALRR